MEQKYIIRKQAAEELHWRKKYKMSWLRWGLKIEEPKRMKHWLLLILL